VVRFAGRDDAGEGVKQAPALLLAVFAALCADAAEIAEHEHLGVASCATGVCHGKLAPQEDANVWLNEYRIWSADDRHARAYLTLGSPESKEMAAKLGLASAQTAKICLDCHADNVPQDKRGRKFQISDGIACEACHGGAQAWIESHTEPSARHADNVAKGLYPTEDPRRRADLCLGCHMGADDRFATHVIMGAGHPRLSFELDAFTVNQPAHFAVDADYVERKGEVDGFRLWLAGQLMGAGRMLGLQASGWFDKPEGLFPELALYDCQSCHHAMDDVRWSVRRAGPGIRPGTLRLNDDHLRILLAVTSVIEPAERATLAAAVQQLVRAGQQSASAVRQAAKTLDVWISARENAWGARAYGRDTIAAVRKAIVSAAAQGDLADYGAAEQVFLAVDSLSLQLGDADRLRGRVDALYQAVETDQSYRPAQFAKAAASLLEGL
jgi:hypothetical protein